MGLLSVLAEHPALSAAAGFFICFEGHYLWRLLARTVADRFLLRRISPLETIRNYSVCTTTDLDAFLHMNNARYAREMDFGRWGYYVRTGLYRHWRGTDVRILQASMIIRFRKEVSLLMPFVVETRLVYWDEASFYFEQKLVTLHDGRARCVSLSQQRVLGSLTPVRLMALGFDREVAPSPPSDSLRAFIDANAASQRDLAVMEKRV
ncbi:protein THEM6-like [Pollicipes pollicipes]|uniref:protein THEM6-like n=1 Tax=Pollicipes pollicipes TaxID=41117 RepID=UPI001884DD9B|nr:protein THEM6-like [Pollicipes pollicipes]